MAEVYRRPDRDQIAARVRAEQETELPLRVLIDDAGTPLIRCLCGTELAAVRGRELTYDFSPGGLIRMVLHARHCNRTPE